MINVRDLESVRALRPFLVAHRGGVITANAPENSMPAIRQAAAHGYAMVELDVMEAADAEPVLIHDGLYINCGVRAPVYTLTSGEIAKIRYRASDQPVLILARALAACATLGLGVMLDKLARDDPADPQMSPACLDRIASLLHEHGLDNAAVAIVDSPRRREHLRHVLFPVGAEDYLRILAGESIPLHGQFWFGWAAELPGDAIPRLHENGAFAIVSINTFHYPHHAPFPLAREDVIRLREAACDGFQIDSDFESFFQQT
jgi:hypothetical protein